MKQPKKGSVVWLSRKSGEVVRVKVCSTTDHLKAKGEAMAEWSKDIAVANDSSLTMCFSVLDEPTPPGLLSHLGLLGSSRPRKATGS